MSFLIIRYNSITKAARFTLLHYFIVINNIYFQKISI